MFPAKSLTELAYRTYKQNEDRRSLSGTLLIPITIDELDIPDPKHPWIARLLGSKLLFKGGRKGNYLIYPPHVFFESLYAEDEVEFRRRLLSRLFQKATILTSEEISPHTKDGYLSTEIDIVFSNEKLYQKVHKCLSDTFFWNIPDYEKIPELVLLALTQFTRADGRTLLNMYQLFRKMKKRDKTIFIDLIHKTSVPLPITKFVLDILGGELRRIEPIILHPAFNDEWNTLIKAGMSGTMFLDLINPGWNEQEVATWQ